MTPDHDTLFRTLADPTRRALFERLCRDGDQTVGALTAQAGISQPAVSKHLKVLKEARLVVDRQEGTRRVYQVEPRGVEAMRNYLARLGWAHGDDEWTRQMAGFWQDRLDALEDLLTRMDQ